MRIVGFGQNDTNQVENKLARTVSLDAPVRSLASINFERMNHALTYYNDQFDLKPGDRVFVTGKLEGEIGIVESVTTKFRIKLADYKKVISLAQTPMHGTYSPKGTMMRSYDPEALSPNEFRQWILPPKANGNNPEDEIIFGDGFEIPLDDPSSADGVDPAVFDRAINLCRSGKVAFVSVRNGEGKAFVRGSCWYEIDFTLRNNLLQEAYCECPYAGLCKHLLAVSVIISIMRQHGDLEIDRDFTLIEENQFSNMARHTRQDIIL